MAQGTAKKLSKRKRSVASQKRRVFRTKTATKGPRQSKSKHASAIREASISKVIDRKNEAEIAAKAVAVGTQFFLSDVKKNGQKVLKQQRQARDKKQQGASAGVASRLTTQLRKLGRDV